VLLWNAQAPQPHFLFPLLFKTNIKIYVFLKTLFTILFILTKNTNTDMKKETKKQSKEQLHK